MSIAEASVDRASLQRRTITTLRLAQVPGQAAIAGVVAVLALFVGDLLGDDRFAGSGNAAFTLGSAFMAPSFSAFSRRRGRRPAMTTALLIGACGATVAAVGGQMRWVWLLLVGMVLFGGAQAASLQGRFVAADLAEPGQGPTAIAAVVWLGTLGAVFGPVLTPQWKRLAPHLGLDPSVGPIAFASVLALLAAAIIWWRLRPDPLMVIGGIDPAATRIHPLRSVRRSWTVIGRSRLAQLGLASMVVVQATMVAVMTMTPPHMRDHHQGDSSAYVIALHIAGMYGLAPWVGRFVERVRPDRAIVIAGIVLSSGTAASVLAGYHRPLIFVGLFLLGLGWNIGLIAGSSLVSSAVAPTDRVEVQGTADLTMSFCGGCAAFGSGFIKRAWGFHLLANGASLVALALAVYASTMVFSYREGAYSVR
ncbi:MAG TPA: MFS transporter [Ilumatobacteraceae bacterium]|nr:MFS transporter [Ilumatobacteraceae bacterium]